LLLFGDSFLAFQVRRQGLAPLEVLVHDIRPVRVILE
jgi:hypothetical protein